jgi:hypothetical protein
VHQFDDRVTQPKLLRRQLIIRDLPQNHGDKSTLLEYRYPEPSEVAKSKAKVSTSPFLQLALAPFWGDAFHQGDGVLRFERFCIQLSHPTMKTEHWWLPANDVNVADALLDGCLEQFVNQNGCHRKCLSRRRNRGGTSNDYDEMRIVGKSESKSL